MNGQHAMSALLLDLVSLLSREPLGVEDIVARVGPVVHDPGGLMPIELRPNLPGVRSARLGRYPDSGLPYLLDFALDTDAPPTAGTLKGLFGDYDRALTDRGQPRTLLFYPPAGTTSWRVVLIAQLASSTDDLDAATVSAIAFRRDPVAANMP